MFDIILVKFKRDSWFYFHVAVLKIILISRLWLRFQRRKVVHTVLNKISTTFEQMSDAILSPKRFKYTF